MSVNLISPAMWQAQRWRNGGGTTHELICEQDTSGIIWRISIASVEQDGDFSLFPGVDRIIMLLEGKGCLLNFANGTEQLINQALQPFSFSGESEIYCSLLSGKIRDLNLMTRRSSLKPRCTILQLPINTPANYYDIDSELIAFVANGEAIIQVNQQKYVVTYQHILHVKEGQGIITITNNKVNTTVILFNLIKTISQ